MGVWQGHSINVPDDTALIFEGGGMRCAYTAGINITLMKAGIHFAHVYGISAGSSSSGNYVSGDLEYARASFVDLGLSKRTGGWGSFLRGKGYFNAADIYQPGIMPGGAGPFMYDDVMANPTKMTIQAFARDTGRSVFFTKEDFSSADRLMLCVRASSTVPIMMPPPQIDGVYYYDGGLADSAGILLHKAMDDGYKRFFIVHTRKKGYRKGPVKNAWLYKLYFCRHPLVAKAIIDRNDRYNALLDEIEELNRQGVAYSVYADDITVSSSTLDYAQLKHDFDAALAQGERQVDDWKRWLGVD